jgi:hypothetical protein
MNRLRSPVLVAILVCLPLSAFPLDLTAGVKGGAALPFLAGSDYLSLLALTGTDTRLQVGYSLGAFLNVPVSDLVAFQAEVLFSMMGGARGDALLTEYRNYSFIQVPLLVQGRWRLGRGYYTGCLGVDLLIPVGSWTLVVREADSGRLVSTNPAPMDQVNPVLFGIAGGLGVIIPAGAVDITFDARYSFGLTDVESYSELTQQVVELLVGMGYNAGR